MSEVVARAIGRLAGREPLPRPLARETVLAIMDGEATPAQIGALLVAWRMKGETVDEVVGAAEALRARATRVETRRRPLLDTCGTGGDGSGSFNLSTASALVAAAGGAAVAKHGNRAVSSRCGSADVLEAAGVAIDLAAPDAAACLDELGVAFLFAPRFHPAMRHAAGPRREIRLRTLFNLLGPLANPAGAERQLLGAYSPEVASLLAAALAELGTERAFVVHGDGGLDELSLSGPSRVFEVEGGRVTERVVHPEDAGIPARRAALAGGDAAENARLMAQVLTAGDQASGAVLDLRDAVILNAGAAIQLAGLAPDLKGGAAIARAILTSGAGATKLTALADFTRARARAATPAGDPAAGRGGSR
jgi:anthranilate phosphoribosyltransferase